MLIKLIAADSNHFIRYKCKITHCLDSQILSEYISAIPLDDNEKLSINEVLEVLTFIFYLVVPYSVYFLSEFEATSYNAMFVERWGKYIYP